MKTYLRTWLGACAVLGVCVALVNLTVDPYGFFMLITVKGFNAIKPHAETHSGMVKPYLIEKMRPGSILLGDSRVEVGFDPESAAWPDDAGLVLNLGLPGTGTYTASALCAKCRGQSASQVCAPGRPFQ